MPQELFPEYKKKKTDIKKRLDEFRAVWEKSDKVIFSELCFCICTPQSKAVYCDKAISDLTKKGILYKGNIAQIRDGLKGVRFPNNKARYIVEAHKSFCIKGSLKIKDKININNISETRDWFVRNVKGLGFKEASHFLRNIGFGRDFAILDVHILRNMVRYGIVPQCPKNITGTQYLFLENELKKFSGKIGIPMDELDLLFWSSETGEIFK
ncbi:MAG: N-glycosylase/DNA lyase [Candidatus Omnitrophica bacterium]|nr:N-glycosylase/DNA lyase [Candidatus Omnitrophota bacterium]